MAVLASFVALSFGGKLARSTDSDQAPRAAVASSGTSASSGNDAPSAASMPARVVANPTLTVAADYRGHYMVHPTIDNYRVKMMVDTGATTVALTASDAKALGLALRPSDYTISLNTANGLVRGARVILREVRLGDILVRNVEAVVLPAGALSMSLLGSSFLGKLKGYEVQTGRMVLRG